MKKTILWSIIGILAIVTAVLLYNVLSKEYSSRVPDADTTPKIQNTENNTDKTEPQDAKEPDYIDFTVYTYEGEAVKLSDILNEGKPVVVNFWTTWCGYCKQEMPDFNEIYKEYSDRVSFMMVDVNGGGNDDMEEARSYVTDAGYEFPVYYDTELSAASAYGLRSFPTTLIIAADGVTEYASPGMLTEQRLLSLIETALN